MLNALLIIVAIALAFVMGTIGGYTIATESIQPVKIKCCTCGDAVLEKEVIFCEDCYEDNDSLSGSIKEKEVDIRYKTVSLKQRGVVNQPESMELDNLEKEVTSTDKLCESVETINKTLDLSVDVGPLKERNKELRNVVNKWKAINDKENKIDAMLWEHES